MEKLLHERFLDDASMGEQTFSAQELHGFAEEIEKFYLPRPRFEDGEPVKIGDNVNDRSVCSILVFDSGWFLIEDKYGTTIEDACSGFPVKRGTTLDADGANTKVGDIVWSVDPENTHSAEVIRCDVDSVDVRWDDGVVDYIKSPKLFAHREPDSLEKLRDDMVDRARQSWGSSGGSLYEFADRLNAIINKR